LIMAAIRLLGDARRSTLAALDYSFDAYGEEAAIRYAALINQAIADFAATPSARTVRRMEHPWTGKVLLRYDLALRQNNGLEPSP
jgi:plasmid stabilization system protein ParE